MAAHPFIRELAAGELPAERFRFYLEQNLYYLPQYARVMALGAAKAGDDRELAALVADLLGGTLGALAALAVAQHELGVQLDRVDRILQIVHEERDQRLE